MQFTLNAFLCSAFQFDTVAIYLQEELTFHTTQHTVGLDKQFYLEVKNYGWLHVVSSFMEGVSVDMA